MSFGPSLHSVSGLDPESTIGHGPFLLSGLSHGMNNPCDRATNLLLGSSGCLRVYSSQHVVVVTMVCDDVVGVVTDHGQHGWSFRRVLDPQHTTVKEMVLVPQRFTCHRQDDTSE